MKKYKGLLILSLVIAIITGVVFSIIAVNKKEYTNEYSAEELYKYVSENFSTVDGMKVLDNDIILEFTDEKPSYLDSYSVYKSNNAKNVNEIGIFKVEGTHLNDMKIIIEKYVSNLKASYTNMNYFPEEIEKINFSTVRIFGNYVIYSFLNEKDSKAFYEQVNNILKK